MKLKEIALMLAVAGIGAPALAEEPMTPKAEAKEDASEVPELEVELSTISKMVQDGQTFSILESAVKAAGLEETLAEAGPYTVFAPTDEAFAKLDPKTLDQLMLPEHKEKLRSLLLYHVVAGDVHAATLKDSKVKSLNGELIEIDVDDNRVELEDGAKVVNADLAASNGVIHVIDKVIVPKSLDGFFGLDDD